MSKGNAKHEKQEDYFGILGTDISYAKPEVPQTPPIQSSELAFNNVLEAFEDIDVRKLTDEKLKAYLDVAYESYVYAEAITDIRRRRGRK